MGDLIGSRAQRVALAVYAIIVVASLVGAVAFERLADPLPGPNDYDVVAWEVRHFAKKWLFQVGELFRSRPSLDEENAQLTRFILLNREIAALEQRLGGATREQEEESLRSDLARATSERDDLEARAQAVIEGRITAIAEREGLDLSLPLLPDLLWPPVDLEFTTPPRSLAISRRDRIELVETSLLREGLDLAQVDAVEAEREVADEVSALAFNLGGVGAYPTINRYPTDYFAAVELAAHEWMHNYLFFRPLGIRYYASNDLRTLNETVADLVGREIAREVVATWPLPDLPAREPAPPPRIDVGAELRSLRGDVETLLAAGEIEAAEALMEERRLYLAENGVFFRKLNQAYFAYTNLYAGEAGQPGATNPIGPKVDELRRLTSSLGQFVRLVDGFTSVADLDQALAALGGASTALP